MGLFQKACETYDRHRDQIGKIHTGQVPLAPIFHLVKESDIEITIDAGGNFQKASPVDKKEPKIIIPVTEKSAGRTSAPFPHPLCEQLCYLSQYDEEKYTMYVEQLKKWVDSEYTHPKLRAILKYVKGGTILKDLEKCDIVSLDESGNPENEKDGKLLVRWVVNGIGEKSGPCWTDTELFELFINFNSNGDDENPDSGVKRLCMVSGEEAAIAEQHSKGIYPVFGNAKLISANDTRGFTYRGRFNEAWQAATVSHEATQKAHNALRWLIANQGVRPGMGDRVFLCWNPKGKEVPSVFARFIRKDAPKSFSPSEYKEELRKALLSYRYKLPETDDDVVIAAFDAATTGRLSLTYYNELQASDFIQRLHDWDYSCCWQNGPFGIQAPSLEEIVKSAFGIPRTEADKSILKVDDRVGKQQIQRLMACRVDKALIPSDIVENLVCRASYAVPYDRNMRAGIVFTACALIKKYRQDKFKEVWEMALERNKMDRSYQFGRLLAVYEKMEMDALSSSETRVTNAIKRQMLFCRKPLTEAEHLESWINKAYLPKLTSGQRIYYDKLKGEIMNVISQFDDAEINRPLTETYLLGYSLQKMDMYTKKNETKEMEEE